ncbi:hypothetical protein ACVW1A_007944 [Bradyrhizobium sp. LB1.3]
MLTSVVRVLAHRTLVGGLRRERSDPVGRLLRLWLLHGALGREVRHLPLQKTLACGREPLRELRGREAILERVTACDLLICLRNDLDVGLRVRRERRRIGRLAALNQCERQRHHGRDQSDPERTTARTGRRPVGTNVSSQFRNGPDHPPMTPSHDHKSIGNH